MRVSLWLLWAVSALHCIKSYAAPIITSGGIVNGASFKNQFVPGGGIAQGSIATLFGTGMGPTGGVSASTFPLSPTLAGVAIKLSQGLIFVNALPVFVKDTQINFVVPSSTPLGQVEVRLTYSNEVSAPATFEIVKTAFGLFTFAQGSVRANPKAQTR